jgi:hypothetical protein
LAGYSQLSALSSYGIKIHKIVEGGAEKILNTIYSCRNKAPSGGETRRKIYIQLFINSFRTIGHLDSGSDVSIIQLSVYNKMRFKFGDLHRCEITELVSFSNGYIPVKGKVMWEIKLDKDKPGFVYPLYVIRDIEGTPKILLGNDILKHCLGSVAYVKRGGEVEPEVKFSHPYFKNIPTFYEDPAVLNVCFASVKLKPLETSPVTFYLKSAAEVVRTDYILITSGCINEVFIIPSRTDLDFDQKTNQYTCTALVANLSKNYVNTDICGRWEKINDLHP